MPQVFWRSQRIFTTDMRKNGAGKTSTDANPSTFWFLRISVLDMHTAAKVASRLFLQNASGVYVVLHVNARGVLVYAHIYIDVR